MKRMKVAVILLMMISGVARAITYPFTTVDTPGFHKLLTNVSNQITISVSDVTLDLNGGTVSGGTNGIVINGGLNNVTIRNGVITSVSSDGIQVGAGCSDITLKDITVTSALRGMNLEQVTNALLRNCDMHQSTTGLELDTCHNIVLQNCTARANTHAGFDVISSTTCSFIECSALSTGDGNSDISSEVFGFVSANGYGNIFERCIANSTQALSVTGSSSLIAGFALRGSESCTKIIDSEGANSEVNANGVSVPYGILVEQTISDLTQVATAALAAGDIQTHSRWNPNGDFIAVAESSTGTRWRIYKFDRRAESLTSVATVTPSDGFDVAWSPSGRFLAAGAVTAANPDLAVYEFDYQTFALTLLDSRNRASNQVSVAWSPDERFLAVGDTIGSSLIEIYEFDAESKTITLTDSVTTSGDNRGLNWSHDGTFLANVNVAGDDMLRVFQFDRATKTLIEPVVASVTLSDEFRSVQFSPDDHYIAIQGGGTDTFGVRVYSFDGSSLSFVAGAGAGNSGYSDLDWSADGRYLAVGSPSPTDTLKVYFFDRGSQELIEVGSFDHNNAVRGSSWSPDGKYIALSGTSFGGVGMRILTGLNSPENNVIKGNTVYCNSGAQTPSGIGISGSSIANMIIGNTAFNNPIPRGQYAPSVSSNYTFVTNVFNQLFGEGPSSIQNISTSGMTPLATVPDVPAKTKRVELLLESLIDNLL